MAPAARDSAAPNPARSDSAPHRAEPKAKAPSEASVCMASARERTQAGTLVWVAALKVEVAAIQAPPPSHRHR